jgi:hypothetical protein
MTLYYENSTISQATTTLSAAVQGATGATGATGASFNIIDNSSTATLQYLTFAGTTGAAQVGIDTVLTYQPSTNILTCGSLKATTIRDISNNTGSTNQVLNAISGGGGVVWSYPTPQSVYGDGADGTVLFNGFNQYPFATLTTVGSVDTYTLIRDVWATNLTVNILITVITAGYRMFAQTGLTNNGTIHNNGSNGNGTIAGTGGLGGYFKAGGSGAVGLLAASAGANGVDQATPTANTWVGGLGGKGGQGRASNTTFTGGMITNVNLTTPLNVDGGSKITSNFINYLMRFIVSTTNFQMTPSVGGGSGAKSTTGTTATSGGGGGGGGICVVASPIISGSGTISAYGGNGGDAAGTGGNFGGGGGGGGGVCAVICRSITNSYNANGGNGGISVYTGTGDYPIATANGTATTLTQVLTLTPTEPLSIGKLYMITFHLQKTGGIGASGINSITGYGITWTLINGSRVEYNSIASPTRVQETWYGYYTGVQPDLVEDTNITIALSDLNSTARVIIDEITNIDTVSSPISANIGTNSSNSATALTITLASLPTAGNMVYSVFTRSGGTAPVAGANNTLVNNQTVAPIMVSEVNTTGQQANAMSHTTAAAIAGFSVEISKTVNGANEGSEGWNGKVVRIFG